MLCSFPKAGCEGFSSFHDNPIIILCRLQGIGEALEEEWLKIKANGKTGRCPRNARPLSGTHRGHKSQPLVEMPRMRVACHRSVKLHHAEAVRFGLRKAVRHQLFTDTDVQSAEGSGHSAAHVGDAAAGADVVW